MFPKLSTFNCLTGRCTGHVRLPTPGQQRGKSRKSHRRNTHYFSLRKKTSLVRGGFCPNPLKNCLFWRHSGCLLCFSMLLPLRDFLAISDRLIPISFPMRVFILYARLLLLNSQFPIASGVEVVLCAEDRCRRALGDAEWGHHRRTSCQWRQRWRKAWWYN